MSELESQAAPRRRRADRNREEAEMSAAEFPAENDTGTSYAVGNAGRANGRFGETQRMADSQNQWAVPPYASGSYDPVGAGGQTGTQNPWVSGVHDVVYTPWNAQNPDPSSVQQTKKAPVNPEARRKKKRTVILTVSLAVVVAAVVALIIFLPGILQSHSQAEQERRLEQSAASLRKTVAPYDERFCENVWVDGVHLGGSVKADGEAVG